MPRCVLTDFSPTIGRRSLRAGGQRVGGRTQTVCVLCATGRPLALPVWRVLVTLRRGRLVPRQGELLAALFESVAEAVECAVELQDEHVRDGGLAGPRLGIAAGDAQVGDAMVVAGSPLAEATALALRAEPGQVLVSAAVPLLLDGSLPIHFVNAGELGGPWRPRPRPVWGLVRPTSGQSVIATVNLPPLLRREAAWPWLPPGPTLAGIEAAWAAASAGQRQFVLVAGEAGAGKTRLVSELGRRSWDEGALVLAGACFDHELAFQPFVEALRHPLEAVQPARRRQLVGPAAADLDYLLPGLGLDDGAGPGPRGADAASRRYWMFDAVADLLRQLGQAAPVLLVLDDLHWARLSTTLLLELLLAGPDDMRVLILGTCRRSATEATSAFSELLARLSRDVSFRTLQLEGLDEAAVCGPVTRSMKGLQRLCRHLAHVTGGNPSFIESQWQQLVLDGRLRCLERAGGQGLDLLRYQGCGEHRHPGNSRRRVPLAHLSPARRNVHAVAYGLEPLRPVHHVAGRVQLGLEPGLSI